MHYVASLSDSSIEIDTLNTSVNKIMLKSSDKQWGTSKNGKFLKDYTITHYLN